MSPVLTKAVRNYERFTDQLTKLNKKAYESSSKGFGTIGKLTEEIASIPTKLVSAYESGVKKLQSRLRVLTQKVALEFSPKSEQNLSRIINKAIGKTLGKVNLRLSAAVPLRRHPLFAHDQSLRAAYRDMVQPPDMKGAYQNLPRFAEGGEVTGGKGKGIDDVLALLSKGEIVLPADIAKRLKEMAATASLKGLGNLGAAGQVKVMRDMLDLLAAMTVHFTKIKKQGPDAFDDLADSISDALDAAEGYNKSAASLTKTMTRGQRPLDRMEDGFDKLDDTVEELTETVQLSDNAFMRFLQKTLSPERILVIQHALDALSASTGKVRNQAETLFEQAAGGRVAVEGFMEGMNEANRTFGMSREELAGLKVEMAEAADAVGLAPSRFGRATVALRDMNMTAAEVRGGLADVVATMGAAGIASEEQLATSVRNLSRTFGFAAEDQKAFFLSLREQMKATGVPAEHMIGMLQNIGPQFDAFVAGLADVDERRRAMEGMAAAFAGVTQAMGDGGEAAQTLTDLISKVAVGDVDAMQLAARWGLPTREIVQQALRDGDLESIVGGMAQRFGQLASSSNFVAEIAKVVDVADARTLTVMGQKADVLGESLRGLADVSVDTSRVMQVQAEAITASNRPWDRFTERISSFITSRLPQGVLEFFESISLQAAFSTVVLAKYSLEMLGAAGKMLGFGKAAKGVVAATQATSALATTAKATGGGGLIAGMFKGIAQGIKALGHPKVLAAMAIIGGTIIGIQLTAEHAKPMYEALTTVATHALDTFKEMFTMLTSLDATHALAVGASLLMLGPAFGALGGGLLVFGQGAMLGAPGIMVFGKAMKAMGADIGDNLFMGTIQHLVDMFQMDTTKLQSAVRNVAHVGGFLIAFTGTLAAMGIARMVSFFQSVNPLEGLTILLTGKDWNQLLGSQARGIKNTVLKIADTFGSIGAGQFAKLASAGLAMGAIAKFLGNFGKAVATTAAMRYMAAADAIGEVLVQVFTKKTSMMLLAEQAEDIKLAAVRITSAFGSMNLDVSIMDKATDNMTELAFLMADFGTLEKLFKDVRPGMFETVALHYLEFFDIKGPMGRLRDNVQHMQTIAKDVTFAFAALDHDLTDEVLTATGSGLKKSIELLQAFRPVIEEGSSLAELSDALTSGFWGKLWQKITGTDSPLVAMKNVLIGEDGILNTLDNVGAFMEGVMGSGGSKTYWRTFTTSFGSIMTGFENAGTLLSGMTDVTTSFKTALSTTEGLDQSNRDLLPNRMFGIMRAIRRTADHFNSFGVEELKAHGDRAAAVRGIVENWRATLEAVTPTDSDVRLIADVPNIESTELDRVVRVEIEGQQRPLLDAAHEQVALLGGILNALTNRSAPVAVAPRYAPKTAGADTQRLARGGD